MSKPHPSYTYMLPRKRMDEEEVIQDDEVDDVVCTDMDVALGVVPPLGSRYDVAGRCWRR